VSDDRAPGIRLQGPDGCEYCIIQRKEITIRKNNKIIAYICSGCGEWFSYKKDLKFHKRKICPYFNRSKGKKSSEFVQREKEKREMLIRQELGPDYGY
jgi:hypothetical protein